MLKRITKQWVRITKHQARARYKTRQDVYILPHKMHPDNDTFPPVPIIKADVPMEEALCEMMSRINFNSQAGEYPAFYITREEYDERMGRGFV